MTDNERFFVVFDELKNNGLISTYVELADALGTNKAGINDLKAGRKKLTIENIRSLKKSYHRANIDFILTEMGEPLTFSKYDDKGILNQLVAEPNFEYVLKGDKRVDRQLVPLYNIEAAASLKKVFNGNQNIIDYLSIPNLPKCDGAVYITGDSMYPLLKSGDIAAYKVITDIPDGIFWGEMYVLSVIIGGDDMVLTKFIQKSEIGPEYIKLVSQNQHHQPKDVLLKNITALGLIKASIRFNSMN